MRVTELEDSATTAAKYADDPSYAFKAALYQRRISVLRPIAEAAEAKLVRVGAELDSILWRNVLAKEICDRVYEKLPRELRDIIYEHVDPFDKSIEVDCAMKQVQQDTTYPQFGQAYKSDYFGGDCSKETWDAPWYLDTNIISSDFAVEMLETLHHKTVFIIEYPHILGRFLSENRWKGFKNLIPKDIVRNIRFDLPPGIYITDKLFGVDIVEMLTPLRTLTHDGVRITIDVQSDYRFIPGTKQLHPRHVELLNGDLYHDDEIPTQAKIYKHYEIVTEERLSMLLQQLLPLLGDLFGKGHVITIEDNEENWYWVMSNGNMSVDDVLKYRRSCWT